MRQYCLGAMGMGVKEMECMTYHDLLLKIEGFQQHLAMQEDWVRNIAYSAYSPHLGKNAKKFTLEKFWPIPRIDEKKKKVNRLTPERRKRVADTIKQMMGSNGKT